MIKIFCTQCKRHIYNYVGIILKDDRIYSDRFKPANKKIKQPEAWEPMICSFCKKYFGKDSKVLTNKGLLPEDDYL